MPFDGHKNLAYSTVAAAPSPASSGLVLGIASGDAAKMPAPPFDAVVWPAGAQPLTTNAEVVRVTGAAPYLRESMETTLTSNNLQQDKNGNIGRYAQSYTAPAAGVLESLWLHFIKHGAPADSITVELRSDVAGVPGTLLSTVSLAGSSFAGSGWQSFAFTNSQVQGTTYWIVVFRSGATDVVNWFDVHSDAGYANGQAKFTTDGGGSWIDYTGKDLTFRADLHASADTLVILRARENSSARSIGAGDLFAAAITKKPATDIEAMFSPDIALSAMISSTDNALPAGEGAYVCSDYEIGTLAAYTGNSSGTNLSSDSNWIAQSFKQGGLLQAVTLALKKNVVGVTGSVFLDICPDRSGVPGPVLVSSPAFDASTLNNVETAALFVLSAPVQLAAETTYWLVLRTSGLAGGFIVWYGDIPGSGLAALTSSEAGLVWVADTGSYKYTARYLTTIELGVGAVLEIG